jgi:ankyrin repeat protein
MNRLPHFFVQPILLCTIVSCGARGPGSASDLKSVSPSQESQVSQKSYEQSEALSAALFKGEADAIAYWKGKNPDPSLTLCLLFDETPRGKVTPEMLSVLFDMGANPNAICDASEGYFSPLMRAIYAGLNGRNNIVATLLSKKADPNLTIKYNQGRSLSPLISAVGAACGLEGKDASDEVLSLINEGANINYQGGSDKLSALMIAAQCVGDDMVQLLLSKGARKDLVDAKGKSAEDYAARSGNIARARLLASSLKYK